jgi:hypothetical protein
MPIRNLARVVWRKLSHRDRARYYLLRAKLRGAPRATPAAYNLISYPKCGRTWLRCLIGRTYQTYFQLEHENILEIENFSTLHPLIPSIHVSHDDNPMWQTPNELDRSKQKYAQSKVIFLVRDPRDVVVSMYFHRNRRKKTYDGSLAEFIREPRGGLGTIIEFMNIWANNRNVPQSFLLVRYEELRQDTAQQLRAIMNYLGLPNVSEETIQDAVRYCSFENMHKMESGNLLDSPKLRPKNPNDPESFKTRKGVVAGYTAYLDREDLAYLDRQLTDKLSPYFGYSENAAL